MNKHQNIKLLSNDMLFHAGGLVLEGFMNLEMAMWSRYPKETVTNCYSNKWPQISLNNLYLYRFNVFHEVLQ